MSRPLVLASTVVAVAFLLAPVLGGCRKPPPPAKPKPLYRIIEEVDIWVDRAPPYRYAVLTSEDAMATLDARGQRDVRVGGDEAVLRAVARRAKAIGADAALMIRKGPAGELSRMTMYVRYTDAPPDVTDPTSRPAPPASP